MAAVETITIPLAELAAALTRRPEGSKMLLLMPGGNQKFNYGCESVFTRKHVVGDDGYNQEKRNGVSHL